MKQGFWPLVLLLLQGYATLYLSSPSMAGVQPIRPLPKKDGCPSDYSSWDGYCLPGRSARGAIERIGAYCPTGFEASGAYCVAYPQGREAIPKVGYSCPPGWDSSGAYCLSP